MLVFDCVCRLSMLTVLVGMANSIAQKSVKRHL